MATDDKAPRSVMSRGKGDGHVVHGARMVKHRRWTSPHRGTWPAAAHDESRESELDAQPASKRQKRPRVLKEKSAKPITSAALIAATASTSPSPSAHTSHYAVPTLGSRTPHAGYDGDDPFELDGAGV